jgi:secreted PhoX family phosphatase
MDIESFAIGLMVSAKNGGGSQPTASPWTKLAEQDFTVSTSSTTPTDVGTINIPGIGAIYNAKDKYIWVFTRDKAGKRNAHYYGNDNFRYSNQIGGISVYKKSNGDVSSSSYSYGIFPSAPDTDSITIQSKYNASFGALDGTFHVEVWTMDLPDGISSLYA